MELLAHFCMVLKNSKPQCCRQHMNVFFFFFTLGITLHLFTWHLICYCIALSLSLVSCFWNSYGLSLSLLPQQLRDKKHISPTFIPFPRHLWMLNQHLNVDPTLDFAKVLWQCLLFAGTGQLFLLSSLRAISYTCLHLYHF